MKRFATIIENAREKFGRWFMLAMVAGILFLLFFVTGGGVSHNARWHIDNIEVAGASTVSADAIRELVNEKLSGNYFFVYARVNSYLYPQKEIEHALLEAFPRLDNVHAFRVDAHTVAIAVSERKPYALWCGVDADSRELNAEGRGGKTGMENCWFIDTMGFVFDRAPIFSEGVYMEVYGKLVEKNNGDALREMLPPARFANANIFAQMIRTDAGEPSRIVLKDEGEMEIAIRSSTAHPFLQGASVRFKDEYNPTTLITNLNASLEKEFPDNVALKKKLLYIDMRFGNKIFFGFEN
ncbi:MAG: hypothetical protein HZB12_00255 [Candidatus Yonathbacteria bacterium]|nr:hypothetical protein [Candidatus Yonathbacteria bacterium]